MRNQTPRMIVCRYPTTCPETGLEIRKGDECAYYPKDRSCYHTTSKNADHVRGLQFASAYCMDDANY